MSRCSNSINLSKGYIWADWPAPNNVKALVTGRKNGVSRGAYNSFNLGSHVGDAISAVLKNRQILFNDLKLKTEPFWLNQIHSTSCVIWQKNQSSNNVSAINADASFTDVKQQACVVLTADCLPILLTNKSGNWVAACHAGWRGLVNGIVQNTVQQYSGDKSELIAWIGPAISQKYFEVDNDVKKLFVEQNDCYQEFFEINQIGRYQFDFIALAQFILNQLGIETYGGHLCSYGDADNFYSFRRDQQTGRMASLIWFE